MRLSRSSPSGAGAAGRPPRHRPGRQAGFTLLEVVLAISLTVLLIGTVYAFYHTTLGLRDSLHRNADTALAQRRVLDMMTEDIHSAVAYSTLQMGLDGAADSLSLARAVVPSRAVFASDEFVSIPGAGETAPAPAQPQHDVQLVGYRLNRYEDEEGFEQIGGIERTCQRTVLAETAEEGTNIEVVRLSEHVKFLYLRYWDGGAWAESWSAGNLPLAVRIELGLEPLEEELAPDEYPYETLWRVVHIPAGQQDEQNASGGRGRRAEGAESDEGDEWGGPE